MKEVAQAFYNSILELRANIIWENFKQKNLRRFRDVRNDQYHFIKLQSARQKPDESPQEYADCCRSLAFKNHSESGQSLITDISLSASGKNAVVHICRRVLLLFVRAQGICPRCTSACRLIVLP
jgi:hypothetical protein